MQSVLLPDFADWQVAFVPNEVVLAYSEKSRHAAEVSSDNWPKILLDPEVRVARVDENLGPLGYQTLLVWKLAAIHYQKQLRGRDSFDILCKKVSRELIRPDAAEPLPALGTEADYIWFHVAAIAFGVAAFGLLLFPIVCFVLLDSPQTILDTFAQSEVALALKTSLVSATVCTLVVLLFGVPLAYAIARANFRGKAALETVIDLPILIPQYAVGVAFLWVVGAKGIFGGVLNVPGTMLGVILAQMFVSAPFLIKTAVTSFEAVDPLLESVAQSLGASPAGAFRRVSLPLAARGIFVGCILAWSRAISDVGSVAILAYYPMTASVLVFTRSTQAGIEQARPIAIVLILTCLWVFVGLHFVRSIAFKRFVTGYNHV